MPVNADKQGTSYTLPRPYDVSREAIAEFARATNATADYHFDPAAAEALGYRDVIAPTTFAVIIARAAPRPPTSPTPTPASTSRRSSTARSSSASPARSSRATACVRRPTSTASVPPATTP